MDHQSTIVINLTCGPQEAERYRKIITELIRQGALDVPIGSSELHFLYGELKAIDLNIKQWHANKNPQPLAPLDK